MSKLNEEILRRVGERGLRLGHDYFASGAVVDCRREGDLLKARCRGKSAQHYILSAQLKEDRIDRAECSCPVGAALITTGQPQYMVVA